MYADFKGIIPSSNFEQLTKEEKILHTNYLKQAIDINNHTILNDYFSKTNRYLYLGENRKQKFFSCAIGTFSIINPNDYNLDIADVIEKKICSLFKKTKKNPDLRVRL